jgi:hypothetical protein
MKLTTFTKKDLLVVLACIVFLLANLAAIGPRGRRHAKQMLCLSNLYKWGLIFQQFAADNDGYFNRGWPPSDGEDDYFYGGHHWPLELLPYYGDRRLRFCPVATRSLCEESRTALWAWIRGGTDPERYCEPEGSYGTNEWTGNQPEEFQRIAGANWRTANVAGADNIPLIMDCAWAGGFPEHYDEPPEYEGQLWIGDGNMARFCINRHEGFINSAFLDFSARKVGLKELWRIKWHRMFDLTYPLPDWETEAPWMKDFQDY